MSHSPLSTLESLLDVILSALPRVTRIKVWRTIVGTYAEVDLAKDVYQLRVTFQAPVSPPYRFKMLDAKLSRKSGSTPGATVEISDDDEAILRWSQMYD